MPCKKDIKVTAFGFYELENHFKTKKHAENLAISKTFKPVNMHFAPKNEEQHCNYRSRSKVLPFHS